MKAKKIQEQEKMFNKKKVQKLEEKGITLIALVVTIIILLILAGVTLNMAMNGDGLFSRARNAADKYKKAQDDEGKLMENLTNDMTKISSKKAGTPIEIPEGTNWEKDKVTPIADGKGSAIPIPKGFYYIGGDIDTGIVISDVENDDLSNSKHGNQFVWIPCTAKEYEDATNDIIEKNWKTSGTYKDNGEGNGLGWHDNYETEDNEKVGEIYTTIDEENWENNQTEVAKTSLEKYKGFYVARFEAGIPKEASFYTNSAGAYKQEGRGKQNETDQIIELKPISQKEVLAWNFITQPNAKMVAEKMYNDEEELAKSYLMDNTAWNVICNKFNSVLGESSEGKSISNSAQIGNYFDNNTANFEGLDVLWALHKYDGGKLTCADNYNKGEITNQIRCRE